MKILIDAHLSENRLTGIGRYLNGLIPALVEQGTDHEWFLMLADDLSDQHPLMKIESANVTRIPVSLRGPSLKQHGVTSRIVKNIKPDLYHHPHFDLPLGIAVPAVVTIHDLKYLRHPQFFPQKSTFKKAYMSWAFKQSLRRAHKVIAISEFTRSDIEAFYPPARDKIQVIHHGLDHPSWGLDRSASPLSLPESYILCIAERRPHKDLITLIKAYHHLAQKMDGVPHLVIGGKSYSDYTEPEALATSLEIKDKIHFTGYVSDDQMKALYQNAALFVLPSRYEGFGFPLLEAMLAGVPVIGAGTTAIPEIVGDAGLLFEAGDVEQLVRFMDDVLNGADLKQQLAEKGLERSRGFTWNKAAQETLNCFLS